MATNPASPAGTQIVSTADLRPADVEGSQDLIVARGWMPVQPEI
jgi:hypothetical protein